MTTADDQPKNSDAPRRLLSSLRDVLFENTSRSAVKVSADQTLSARAKPTVEVGAARSVLRAAVDAQLGPGVREFSLQNEALSEALPDTATRRRAALRVLALKGTSREQLCLEVEQALHCRSRHRVRRSLASLVTVAKRCSRVSTPLVSSAGKKPRQPSRRLLAWKPS